MPPIIVLYAGITPLRHPDHFGFSVRYVILNLIALDLMTLIHSIHGTQNMGCLTSTSVPKFTEHTQLNIAEL